MNRQNSACKASYILIESVSQPFERLILNGLPPHSNLAYTINCDAATIICSRSIRSYPIYEADSIILGLSKQILD